MIFNAGTPFAAIALDEVSLTVESGERLAIAGPVGSGKSTMLSALSGVEPPSSGRVLLGGVAVDRRHPPAPGAVGLAFQAPESCLFEKTVFDDVAFAPRHQGIAGEELRRRVEEALVSTGIDPEKFSARNPFSLSTGEQRRVALAGVMAMRPRALLLDEPTAHLDPVTRSDLLDVLIRLNMDTGTTVVMVGHDMDELSRFAERLIIIDGGRKVADGSAASILTDEPLLARHRLDPPGTVELCSLLSKASGSTVAPVLGEQNALRLLAELMKNKSGD